MPEITEIAETWLEAMLGASATLMSHLPAGLNNEEIEQGTNGRGLIYKLIPGSSGAADASETFKTLNSTRIWTRLIYLITISEPNTSFRDLSADAKLVEQLLDQKKGTVAGGEIVTCLYVGPYKARPRTGDQAYTELGAFWEIRAREV